MLVRLLLSGLGLVELFDWGLDADVESPGLTVEDVVGLIAWRIVLLSSVVLVTGLVPFGADSSFCNELLAFVEVV